jgi:hypothetical protein
VNNPHLAFHHFGLAIRHRDTGAAYAKAMGYGVGETVFDPAQNVHLAMCTHPAAPSLELIWPGDSKGPIDALVQRFSSGIIDHLCYAIDDLAAALLHWQNCDLRVIQVSPPKPAPLFGGRRVSILPSDRHRVSGNPRAGGSPRPIVTNRRRRPHSTAHRSHTAIFHHRNLAQKPSPILNASSSFHSP